jgi:hypothetical protein
MTSVERISLFARDLREKLDGSEVSSSRVTHVAHVLLVSLTIHERRFTNAENQLFQRPTSVRWRKSRLVHGSQRLGLPG